jgi:tRNA threonylcarbamoyladenosine biosynthesis protein TsaE
VKPRVVVTHDADETRRLARELATTLSPGDCVALRGELGAGKTCFVRGLVEGLGGNPRSVSSPTFVLLNVYDTPRGSVYHLDAYRVSGPDDFDAIGFDELLRQHGIVVIEWPGRVEALLPAGRIEVILEPLSENDRRIELYRRG